MTFVNGTDNVIVDNQHCRLGGMELTVDCLGGKRRVLSSMSNKLLSNHTFHNLGQESEVRDGTE